MVHRPTVAPGWPQDARNIKWNSSWEALATGRVEVYCPSIREPRPTRVRKPRPWRIPRAIQEDWAKNSRKATKRGAPYSKRVYGVASPDAPKKARKIRYVRRPSINIFYSCNCNQISWAGASVTLNIPVKSLLNDKTVNYSQIQSQTTKDDHR